MNPPRRVGDLDPDYLEAMVERIVKEKMIHTNEETRQAVTEGVRQALTQLGVDTSHPLAMQRDFQRLREWRLAMESTQKHGLITLATIIISGLLSLILIGFRESLAKLFGG